MAKRKGRKRKMIRVKTWDDPVLKETCTNVEEDENIDLILMEIRNILLSNKSAVGLAAPQLGHLKNIFAIRLPGEEIDFYINPVIIDKSDEKVKGVEACLSYPGLAKEVMRHLWIAIEYTDETGKECGYTLKNFEARVAQHELAHLTGQCIVGK